MPINLSDAEALNLSSDFLDEAIVNRMISLINDLEQRIEALESQNLGNAPKTTLQIPSDFAQMASELMAWTLFLAMLGELAWSEAHKAKILKFYGINT